MVLRLHARHNDQVGGEHVVIGRPGEDAAMIARIMGEGQVNLDNSHFTELNKLDDELLAEIEGGDEEGFRRTLGALLDAVRRLGTALPDDALEPSELILPSPDATMEEVREMLSDDGLIPG